MRKAESLDLKKNLTVTDSINFFSPNILLENEIQKTLFEAPKPRHKILMSSVDKLNDAIGQQKVKLAI